MCTSKGKLIQTFSQNLALHNVAEILTVTFVLVVIRNQGRTVANAIAVGANAVAVEGVLPCATDDAVARRRARARLAQRRAGRASSAVAKAAIRTHGAR